MYFIIASVKQKAVMDPVNFVLLLLLLIVISLGKFTFAQKNPNFSGSRSGTIIHLFEWKWADIADECERFLQYTSYGGIQVSPPNENIIAPTRPWTERYQPVSYVLTTRSGNETEFADMVTRCNAAGLRIYADVVFNHMAAIPGTGTAGNKAISDLKSYPGVPFNPEHFHATCKVSNYADVTNIRNCELDGLRDLDHSIEYVRDEIVKYMNRLVEVGVAGFRIDRAKYMWPQELEQIYTKLDDLNAKFGFEDGARPFIYQEVSDLGEDIISKTEYIGFGEVIETLFSKSISKVFIGEYLDLANLTNWGPDWGFLSQSEDALVYVDSHVNQRTDGILNYKTPKQYKMALAFMLAHPYGTTRIISSYFFPEKDTGPPQDTNENIKSPIINADGTCGNGYVCEHRWPQIYNMVEFRTVVEGTEVENWWTDGEQQIAFSRGTKGFVAFSNTKKGDLQEDLQTALPAGTYCDVISGGLVDGKCVGKTLVVDAKGVASVSIREKDYEGVVAVHVNAKLS